MKNKQKADGQSIVAEINRLHGEVGEGLRLTVEKAIRIGELLSEQKDRLSHGEWLPWIEANLKFPVRTAQRYMACWQNRERLNTSSTTHLTIEDLACHSEPKPEMQIPPSDAVEPEPKPIFVAVGKPTEAEKPEPVEDAAADKPESDSVDEDSAEKSLDGIRLFAADLLRLYRESDSAREKLDSLAKDLSGTASWLYETLEDIDPKERRS